MNRFHMQPARKFPRKANKPGLAARTKLRSGEGHCKLTGMQRSMGYCCDGNKIVDCGML